MTRFLLPLLCLIVSAAFAWQIRRSFQSGYTIFDGVIGDRRDTPAKFKLSVVLNVVWLLISLGAFVGSTLAVLD